jgi:hypothetical protein
MANLKRLITVQLTLVAALVALVPAHPEMQSSAPLGVSRKGDSAIEYIGVIEQTGPQFVAVGYLTHLKGLSTSDMFTGPVSEATARFTFSAAAEIANRAQIGATFQIAAPGVLSIYFNPNGGASFGDPTSFELGQEVATIDVRFHNVLSVIAPNLGISSGSGHGEQTAAQSFTLNGRPVQIGHRGLIHDLTLSGKGVRTEPVTPASTTEFAASSVTQ